MGRRHIIHKALATAFWGTGTGPCDMTQAVLKATDNEHLPEEMVQAIRKAITRVLLTKEGVDFKTMVKEVSALLPEERGADEPHLVYAHSWTMEAARG